MSKAILKKILVVLFLSVAAALLLYGSYSQVFENNELDALDLRFKLRPPISISDKVVIIEIDNDTISKIGQFPFNRNYHAELIQALSRAGAKAIVFDIFFSEPRKGDKELLNAISAAGNVYLPYVFELNDPINGKMLQASKYSSGNLPEFTREAKGTGYINVISDPDGKFRRVPLFIQYQGRNYPAISLQVSRDLLANDLRDQKIPLDENSNLIVNFAGKWANSYQHYSFGDILQSYDAINTGKMPLLDLSALKDTICLIGYTADGTTDLHPSPFEPLYPSIGIHADVFNSIINKNFITRVPRWLDLAIFICLILLILAISIKARPLLGFGLLLEINAIFIVLCVFLFNRMGLWIDIFYPVMATTLLYLFCTIYKSIIHFREKIVFESELKIARQIQESFVPVSLPEVKGLDIFASMVMAHEVGGDLYDIIKFNDDKLAVMAGDVMGKGIPAAIFMAMASSSFKFFAKPDVAPRQTLLELNEKILRETSSKRFVTLYYSLFNMKTRVMTYANGGHLPVIYLARDHKPVTLDVEEGFPLGMMKGEYSGREIKFDAGDIFIYYTDGIIEAVGSAKHMYGVDRLMEVVEIHRALPAQEIALAVQNDLLDFLGRNKQQDDVTLIIVKVTDEHKNNPK